MIVNIFKFIDKKFFEKNYCLQVEALLLLWAEKKQKQTKAV